MNEGGVEAPGKPLSKGWGGDLGGPVIVCGIPIASKAVFWERLHQSIELRSKAALTEVCTGIDQMSLPLSPLCAPVLEPNLKI